MRVKAFLIMATLAVALPSGLARASHCESQIYLFTSQRKPTGADPVTRTEGAPTVTSSAGCLVFGEDVDTDVIYPGMNFWQVRWLLGNKPFSGNVTFNGRTVALTFEKGIDVAGRDATWWDSHWFEVDPVATINGGRAVVTVCLDDECAGDTRDTRVYRTVP